MLLRRVITAVIGIPVLLALVYLGGWPLIGAIAIFEAVAVYEVAKMFNTSQMTFFARMAVFWVWALLLCQALHWPLVWGLLAGLLVVVIGAVVLGREAKSFEGAMTTAWVSVYIGLLFQFLIALRALDGGRRLVVLFFGIIWVTDAVAFFVGRHFGRHKLMVHVSPKKTWEGTLGGGLSALVLGIVTAPLAHLTWVEGALFALVVSAMGVVGDLLESQFKRYTGVKDSGGLLPGHGGILDRFDSALLALPFAYYLLRGLGIR